MADDGVCWLLAGAKSGKCGLLIAVSWGTGGRVLVLWFMLRDERRRYRLKRFWRPWWVGMCWGPSAPLRFAQDDGAGVRRIWSEFRLWKSGRMHKDTFLSDESQFILGKAAAFL